MVVPLLPSLAPIISSETSWMIRTHARQQRVPSSLSSFHSQDDESVGSSIVDYPLPYQAFNQLVKQPTE